MRNMTRQGGSIKIFVIVGVILVLIALGVLYGAKHLMFGDKIPSEVALNQPESSQPQGSSNSEKEDAKKDDQTQQPTDNEDRKDEDRRDDAVGSDSSDSDETSLPGASTSSDDEGSTTDSDSSNSSTETLPQSGPSENMAALALSMIAISGVAYVRSLRHL